MQRFRRGFPDAVLALCALLFGSISLFYPFGRDQGLYYYVAREWALRGAVPYLNTFDHKTPGIYILHGALISFFGERLWAIRVAELICVLWIGWIAAPLAIGSSRSTRGFRGFAMLVCSIFYFAFFDFRETGEGEIWLAAFGMSAALVLRDMTRERLAFLAAGALIASAVVMKPSAIWFLLVAVALIVRRVFHGEKRWLNLVKAGAFFAAGSLTLVIPILGYFGAKHALPAMYEIVIVANRFYIQHETGVTSFKDILFFHKWFFDWLHPYSPFCAFGIVTVVIYAIREKDRELLTRYALIAALLIAAWMGVVMQKKYYLGHWGVMVAPATVLITALFADGSRFLELHYARLASLPSMVMIFIVLFVMTPSRFIQYLELSRHTARYALGRIDDEEYASHFVEHAKGAPCRDNLLVAKWIRGRTTANDFIAVRGFQPQIYAFAGRRYPGRFFWTSFMLSPTRAVKHDEWVAEDRAALAKNPPRFVVTIPGGDTSDGPEWWVPFGYTHRETIGDFDILERTPETASANL